MRDRFVAAAVILVLGLVLGASLVPAQTDNFPNYGPEAPARTAAAVTPSDATTLDPVPRALYIGTAGNVAVILIDDSTAVTFVGVTAGSILPVRPQKVMATNTTASNIVAVR